MAIINARGPFIGVNTELDPSMLPPTMASDALNCVLDDGKITKRAGSTKVTTLAAGPVTGAFDYRKNDGSNMALVASGGRLYKRQSGSSTELATGLSATELVSFAAANDKVYFTESTMLKVTDGTTVNTAQIARPSAPSVATSGAAGSGNLSGTYDYKITHYSSTWGQESPASDATAQVEPDDQNVSITGLSASADSRVDKKRIYRRKASVSESVWFFVAEIADADASYTDSVFDVDVSTILFSPLSYSDTLPSFRYIAFQAGVMFFAGSDAFPTRLYFTEAAKPWSVTNFLTVGTEGDNEPITGLWAYKSFLIVFKERSIWFLSGNSASNFFTRKMVPDVGCRSHHSIVQRDNDVFFLSEEGLYVFNGETATEVSDSVKSSVVPRNFARDKYVVGVHDYARNCILWSYSSPGSSTNDKILAYFYSSGTKQIGGWCPWAMPDEVTALVEISDETTKERTLHVGFNDGRWLKSGGTTDDGAAIEWYWRTAKLDLGLGPVRKAWGELTVEVLKRATSNPIEIRYLLDDEASATKLGDDFDQKKEIVRRRVRRASKDIRLEFYNNSSLAAEVQGFVLSALPAGRVA